MVVEVLETSKVARSSQRGRHPRRHAHFCSDMIQVLGPLRSDKSGPGPPDEFFQGLVRLGADDHSPIG